MGENLTEKEVAPKAEEAQAKQASEKLQMCLTHSIRSTTIEETGEHLKDAIKTDEIVKNGSKTQDGRNTTIADGSQSYQASIDGHFYSGSYDSQDNPKLVARWADDLKSITPLKPDSAEYKNAVNRLDDVKKLVNTLPDCSIENKK